MAPRSLGILCIPLLLGGCFFWPSSEEDEPPDPYVSHPQCDDTTTPTQGELGLLEFAYDYGAFGCIFGCSANEPIAERAHVEITALGDVELPPVTLESDAPDVATFEIGDDGDIVVETHAPGQVRLEIHDGASGELLEALPLTVKSVTSIASEEAQAGVLIMVEGSASVPIELLDERGCRMVGIGGVDYALGGGISETQVTLVDALAAWLFESIFGSAVTESLSIDALALGTGSVSVSAPSGAAFDFSISVVDASAVASVTLHTSPDPMTVGSSYSVTADARDASGVVVHSPECAWTIDPATGPVELSSIGRDAAYVQATAPGQAVVHCSIGDAAGELPVAFQ